MVHGVFPGDRLRDEVLDRARQIARLPGDVLARTKENLNEAEALAERRRWLFAHETTNQIEGVAARLARAADRPGPRDVCPPQPGSFGSPRAFPARPLSWNSSVPPPMRLPGLARFTRGTSPPSRASRHRKTLLAGTK